MQATRTLGSTQEGHAQPMNALNRQKLGDDARGAAMLGDFQAHNAQRMNMLNAQENVGSTRAAAAQQFIKHLR